MKKQSLPWFGLCMTACSMVVDLDAPAGPTPLSVRPQQAVPLKAPVIVRFSTAVWPRDAWPVGVRAVDHRMVPIRVVASTDHRQITLQPLDAWPAGEVLRIEIGAGVEDADRLPLAIVEPLVFETEGLPADERTALTVRSPRPGRLAPPNLLRVVGSAVPSLGPDAPTLVLRSESHAVRAPVVVDDLMWTAELPADFTEFGACKPLCPGERYAVAWEGQEGEPAAGHTLITTATQTDENAPRLLGTHIDIAGDLAIVQLQCDEPVFATAVAVGPDAHEVRFEVSPVADEMVRLVTREPLEPNTRYNVVVDAIDRAGHSLEVPELAFRTPARVEVRLTEVVATPVRDWNDGGGDGAFDAVPGGGAVTDADEWLELVNVSDTSIDLSVAGLMLRLVDSTPTEMRLEEAATLRFGAGGDIHDWRPGEALVVRPRGTMSQQDLRIEVVSGRTVTDRLVLAEGQGADHLGGRPPDLVRDALARDVFGRWTWCAPTPGDPLPAVDCVQP